MQVAPNSHDSADKGISSPSGSLSPNSLTCFQSFPMEWIVNDGIGGAVRFRLELFPIKSTEGASHKGQYVCDNDKKIGSIWKTTGLYSFLKEEAELNCFEW